jgi:hypothetical protein
MIQSLLAAACVVLLPVPANAGDPGNLNATSPENQTLREGIDLPVANYGMAAWETKGHGNHRAVLEMKEASPVVKGIILLLESR